MSCCFKLTILARNTVCTKTC